MALEPDCRGRGLELPYQAWQAFRELSFVIYCKLLLLCTCKTRFRTTVFHVHIQYTYILLVT